MYIAQTQDDSFKSRFVQQTPWNYSVYFDKKTDEFFF